jgi:hypothetical protein
VSAIREDCLHNRLKVTAYIFDAEIAGLAGFEEPAKVGAEGRPAETPYRPL